MLGTIDGRGTVVYAYSVGSVEAACKGSGGGKLGAELTVNVAAFLAGGLVWAYWIRERLGGHDPLPRAKRRAEPWGWRQALACLVGFLLLMVVFGAATAVVAGKPSATAMLLAMVMSDGVAAVGIPWFLLRACDARLYQLGITARHPKRDAVYGVLGLLAALVPVYGVLIAASYWVGEPPPHEVEKLLKGEPTATNVGLVVLATAVMAPVAEEILFRGVVLGWLKKALGVWPGILVSSVVFAAAHFDAWPAPLGLFFLSIVLGYLYHRTQSLVAPVVLHAGFNGLNIIVLLTRIWHGESAV